jgi:hypothetical protein
MSAFLSSVKADLLDVRLRLAVLILAIALVAAVAYAALGGGGSSATAPLPATPVATGAQGIAVTQAPANPAEPVAETTNGSSHQRGGLSRNPFTPLPEAKVSATPTQKAQSASGAGTTSTKTSSSSQSEGATTPSKPSTPAKPKTPAVVYRVAVLFGVVPPGTPPQNLRLMPYANLARLTPLPSAKLPLLVFRGVTTGGKSATFTVVGEVILHGSGTCLPSASQCQAIDLQPGHTEEVEYLPARGAAVTYQLLVVSIAASKSSKAAAATFHAESKVGRELLRRKGLLALPWLHYSATTGVLAYRAHPASAARARAAARRRRRER